MCVIRSEIFYFNWNPVYEILAYKITSMTSQPRGKKTKVGGEGRKERTNTDKKNKISTSMCVSKTKPNTKQKRSGEKGVSVHQTEPNVKNKIIKILPLSKTTL